jgi:hypothetical protein
MPSPDVIRKVERAEAAFDAWKKDNPGKRFSDYYVEVVTKQLDSGKPHATLGPKLKGEPFGESGREVFRLMLDEGLRPEHVFVDYGCGSLRIGQHVMRHVAPGHYWGLDVTDRFIRDGVEVLGSELIAERAPHLHVIGPESVAAAAAARPDFVMSMAVLIHVPPEELDLYFDNVMTLAHEGTRVFATYKSTDATIHYSGRSWTHPEETITRAVETRGGRVEFRPKSSTFNDDLGVTVRRGWMAIRR